MHKEPRNGAPIERIYVHTNEGPEYPRAAEDLAAYLASIEAGYHVVVDADSTIRLADDDEIVWGAGGDNTHSLHVCINGRANQSASEWVDTFSRAATERAAAQGAAWALTHNVPIVRVAAGSSGQAPTGHGFAAHDDDNAPAAGGHTDPGPNFPWASFLARVQVLAHPIDWNALAQLAKWAQRLHVKPLREGDRSHDVTILKQLLAVRGYGVGNEQPQYGKKVTAKMAAFKRDEKMKNRQGNLCGGDCADHLLGLK